MLRTLISALLAVSCQSLPATKPESASSAAIEALQKSWEGTQSYEAQFTQTIESKGTGIPEEPSSGVLSVVKPDKLRWEDKTAKTVQILNGDDLWDIVENPRRKSRAVTHHTDVTKSLAKSSLQILAGRGKFVDFYKVKLLSETPKEAVLQLIPKTDTNETLIAKIDKSSYVLRSLTTDSKDSKVVVVFDKIRRNPKFPKQLFTYEKQPNDVVTSGKE